MIPEFEVLVGQVPRTVHTYTLAQESWIIGWFLEQCLDTAVHVGQGIQTYIRDNLQSYGWHVAHGSSQHHHKLFNVIADSELSLAFDFCKTNVSSLSDLGTLVVPLLADDLEN